MNRRQWLAHGSAALLSFGLAGCKLGRAAQTAAPNKTNALPAWTRCVSLRVLQDQLLADCRGGECADHPAVSLGGLTRLDGFVLAPGQKDLVLVGAVQAGQAALHSGDLVVALRSATHRYLDAQRVFTPPGVSLDPRPESIQQLQAFDGSAFNGDGIDANTAIQTWARICSTPQDLRIIGLRRESSHFLRTLAVADEEMKSYIDATHKLDGLQTPSAMLLAQWRQALAKGKTPEMRAGFRMSRYWFNAGQVACAVDDTQCLLTQCQVKLSTEAQMVGEGKLQDSQQRDPLADRAAASFTALLPKLAEQNLLYRELLDIYAIQSLAIAMVQRDALRRCGLELGPLLDRWQVPLMKMRLEVPGRWAMAGDTFQQERRDGTHIHRITLPSCGGVNVNPKLRMLDRSRDKRLAGRAVAALLARPAPDAPLWDLPAAASVAAT